MPTGSRASSTPRSATYLKSNLQIPDGYATKRRVPVGNRHPLRLPGALPITLGPSGGLMQRVIRKWAWLALGLALLWLPTTGFGN